MAHYTFISTWQIPAPLEQVWEVLYAVESWPTWWRGVEETRILNPEHPLGTVGSRMASTWKSVLPYRIHFITELQEIVVGTRIVASADGDLRGTGRWDLSEHKGGTTAVYTWDVTTTKSWMNLLAPVARPLFAHAHEAVMRWGEQGLRRRLGV